MIFACAAAAGAAAVTQNPAWFLSGMYHPPLPGRGKEGFLSALSAANGAGAAINGEALTVALDVIQAWAVVLTMGFTIILFFFLAFCVCSRKDDGYDEFEISQGITTVKICHDGGENGVSLIPGVNGSGTLSMRATDETSEASSRYTVKRELPAIPTSSHEITQGSSNVKLVGGVQVLPSGAVASGGRAAVVKESLTSPEGDLSEGQKDRKAKAEHPYAKVGDGASGYAEVKVSTQEKSKKEIEMRYQTAAAQLKLQKLKEDKTVLVQPHQDDSKVGKVTSSIYLTSSVHSTFLSHSTSVGAPTSPPTTISSQQPSDIAASMAISGRQRASDEMPYMTPPIQQTGIDQQQNFSGDSQDSRGYTSISVREPLSALKARQMAEGPARAAGGKGVGPLRGGLPSAQGEGYYMTVSDDSADEMYACIYEGSRGGGGSETYAQIEPRVTPPSAVPATSIPNQTKGQVSPTKMSRSQEQVPPAPPSVDSLRHVVHSRQASAGSSTSTGMGSPIAEKRGTRSPLPPLPQGDSSLYSPSDQPQGPGQSPPKATAQFLEKTTPRSLEEMYAKVNKKNGHSRGSSAGGEGEVEAPQIMTHSLVETRTHDVSVAGRAKSCDVSGTWSGLQLGPSSENYESIPSQGGSLYSGSDPGYETVKNGEPPYASVGYETVRGSDMDSEPGYETVSEVTSKKRRDPGYESVSNRGSLLSDFEPGYETVTSKGTSDPGYESVIDKSKDEYDPGYEELSHPRAPRTFSETDPNYEQLKFTSSRRSSDGGDSGYEVVKKQSAEGTYEQISDYETQEKTEVFASSETGPLYASVQKKEPFKKDEPLLQGVEDSLLPKSETTLEQFSGGLDLKREIEDLLGDLTKPIYTKDLGDTAKHTETKELTATEDLLGSFASEEVGPGASTVGTSLADLQTQHQASQQGQYRVIDSPEEVELPPAEGEASTQKSCIEKKEEASPTSPQPLVSLSFTSASPPTSETSSSSSKGDSVKIPVKEDKSGGCGHPGGCCPTIPELETCKEDAPLPPPPLIDDDIVTGSPLPPPPLLEDYLPPPPLPQLQTFSELINGISPSDVISGFGYEPQIPPPPCSSDKMNDANPSSGNGINGEITVTINPMATLEERVKPACVPSLVAASDSSGLLQTASFGTSGTDSQRSSVNGSSSVESIITVDAKTGATSATSVPVSPQAPVSISSTFPDSKHSEPNESITPV